MFFAFINPPKKNYAIFVCKSIVGFHVSIYKIWVPGYDGITT